MPQRAFLESVVNRYGVDLIYNILGSQPEDLGPREKDELACDKPVLVAVGSLTWIRGMARLDTSIAVRAVAREAHDLAERR